MVGQTINCGTGLCDTILDEEHLLSILNDLGEKDEEYMNIDETNIDIILDIEEEDGECGEENLKFSYE